MNRLTTLALHKLFYTHTRSVVRQLRPDAIVCTHPIPSAVIARLKRLGAQIPLCTVITDYDAHGTWINREVDLYLVSSDEVKSKLLLRGVPIDKIRVTAFRCIRTSGNIPDEKRSEADSTSKICPLYW